MKHNKPDDDFDDKHLEIFLMVAKIIKFICVDYMKSFTMSNDKHNFISFCCKWSPKDFIADNHDKYMTLATESGNKSFLRYLEHAFKVLEPH